MKFLPLPSVEYLQECFKYDESTGILTWRVRPLAHFPNSHAMNAWNPRFANLEAGKILPDGYRQVKINGRLYYANRIIYKLMTGDDPPKEVDHRNGVRGDNRWSNLRPATRQQNMCNQKFNKKNTSGFRGVSLAGNRFQAHIQVHGMVKYLGRFDTAIEASIAYQQASQKYHGDFASPGGKADS